MSFTLDSDRLKDVYRAQSEAILDYFTGRCRDVQLAIDLVEETFARAYAWRRHFHGATPAEAEAWVWMIARNTLGSALPCGRDVQAPRLAVDGISSLERRAEPAGLRDVLAEALKQLAPEQREALRLRVVLELDYPAVAARLGVSQATARARVSRALRSLSSSMDLPARPA